jgi:CO/xanthine dehydrogenase FAD-binding subunit
MQIADFVFDRPSTLKAALALAREQGGNARFLAGGTDMLVDLKQLRIAAPRLIAIDALTELRGVRRDAGVLKIGALTTMTELATSAEVRAAAPALGEAAVSMGMVQIRNRATIGGNFCAAVPCADTPPICIASDARLRLVSAGGERIIAADLFFVGPRQTVLVPGELLVEILIPVARPSSGASYQRFARRRYASLAVAGAAAHVVLDAGKISWARVALTSVAPTPLWARAADELLVGQIPSEQLVAKAAKAAADAAQPISDLRGSAEYRRDLIETLTTRALTQALTRARAG